jgi:hypothetical protein
MVASAWTSLKMDLRKGVEERFKVLRNAVKPEICAAKNFHIKVCRLLTHLGCLNSNKNIDRNIPHYIYLQNPTYMDIIFITEKISALPNIWNKL